MASIESNIDDIRNAVYGREVRTAIADSIEQINNACTEESSRAQNAEYVIQHNLVTLEEGINESLNELETAVGNVSSNLSAESIRATNAENTKIDKPTTDGTTGQVLTVQSDGSIAWDDPADPDNKIDKPTTDGTTGQVLTVQSDGSAAWQNPPEFSTETVAQAVSDWLDANPSATIDLGDNCINTNMIVDGAVTSEKINGNAVTTAKIANGNVTTDKLSDSSVTTAKILDSAVTSAKLASGSVTSAKLGSASVTTEKLNNGSVTVDKLASGSVTSAKLGSASVTTDKITNGAVSITKISDSAKKRLYNSGSLSPIYIGDFLTPTTHITQSCIKLGTFFYVFESRYKNNAFKYKVNTGNIRKFNVASSSNVEVKSSYTSDYYANLFATNVNIGHANSIAYVPGDSNSSTGTIYVAPVWDCTTGTLSNPTYARYLYVFSVNKSTWNVTATNTIIETPIGFTMISYDPVTQSLYGTNSGYGSDNGYTKTIYKYQNNAWNIYTKVNLSTYKEVNGTNINYNQDMAVYDDTFYFTDVRGDMVYGELRNTGESSTGSPVLGNYVINKVDESNRFRFGEIEGMEFDSQGHLYACAYITIDEPSTVINDSDSSTWECSGGLRNGFIFELPVGKTANVPEEFYGTTSGITDNTLTLSDDTRKEFHTRTNNIKSLVQIGRSRIDLPGMSSVVSIPSGSTIDESTYRVRLLDSITINLAGTLKVNKIFVEKGIFTINGANSNNKLIYNNNYLYRQLFGATNSSIIKFGGSYAVRIQYDTSSVPSGTTITKTVTLIADFNTYSALAVIGTLPTTFDSNWNIKIGSNVLSTTGVYFKSYKLLTQTDVTSTAMNIPSKIQVKEYSYKYGTGIDAGGSRSVTATNLNFVTPSGYTPIGVQRMSSGNDKLLVRFYDISATGTETAMIVVNHSSTDGVGPNSYASMNIIYLYTG